MANSSLYGQATYRVPERIVQDITKALQQYPSDSGSNRAKNLVGNPVLSYSNAKRVKNFLQTTTNTNQGSYALAGGKAMLAWLNSVLGSSRETVKTQKAVRTNAGFTNQYRSEHNKDQSNGTPDMSVSHLKPQSVQRVAIMESIEIGQNHATVVIATNPEGKFLLVKRAGHDDWMPGKWALPGGGVDAGETPDEAIRREMREEVRLEITKLHPTINVWEDGTHVHFFMAAVPEPDRIRLDPSEHSEYAWVSFADSESYDCVPDLKKNISDALRNFQNR